MIKKIGLLPLVVFAMASGIACGFFLPPVAIRAFMTFNALFGNFLGFFIPILILALVTSGIAGIGEKAGRLLLCTALLAYGFTLFSGLFTWFVCEMVYPWLLKSASGIATFGSMESKKFAPYFVIEIKPFLDVMSALVLAFITGIGITAIRGDRLRGVVDEFQQIVTLVIGHVIIPLLPLYIFGIFLDMTASGHVGSVLGVFIKLIVMIFFITVVMLGIQYGIAGVVGHRNPFALLKTMLPAYLTALGTQSSAATIPVTLAQTVKNGVSPSLAGFVIPLCATIHLSGSTMKITACSLAIILMTGMDVPPDVFCGFVFLLGVTMVAAPGVPGGAIMASLGILKSVLGFGETELGLMIALYIAMDSFGTACNVTGDGAIAVILQGGTAPQKEAA